MTLQICSGCDNLCEIGEQYCSDCLSEIAQGGWEENYYEGELDGDSEDPPLEVFTDNRGGGDI